MNIKYYLKINSLEILLFVVVVVVVVLYFSNDVLGVEINSATTSARINENVTITSDGSITISSADAISLNHLNSGTGNKTITNAGSLNVSGNNNQSIHVWNVGSNIISNSGTASVSGTATEAIRLSSSDNNTLTNTGTVSTTGVGASHGITLYLSDSNTINNSSGGTITTSGDNANGIDFEGSSSNTVTNAGTISTSGDYANGMSFITGSDAGTTSTTNNIITNSGTIETTGYRSSAFYIYQPDSNTITNSGSINVSGVRTGAIRLSESDSNTITNSGSVSTTGGYGGIDYAQSNTNSSGITLYLSDSNAVNNNSSGTITTSGDHAYGIDLEGSANNNVTNAGTITTSGTSAYGMRLIAGSDSNTTNANSNTVTNSGTINVSGNNSAGFYINSNSNNVTNSGTITNSGTSSSGINLLGDSNTISHSGTITSSGSNSFGFSIAGSSNTITSSGNYTASGSSASAVYLNSNSNTFANAGTITVSGSSAKGLYINSDSNTVTNSGTITSTGSGAPAIYLNNADSNTITHSGTITTSGSNAYAIQITGNSSSNNFILNSKNIVGEIFSDSSASNTLTINNDYGNSSYFISTTGDWTVNNNASSSAIPNTNVAQIALGKFKNSSELMFERSKGLNDFLVLQNSKNINHELSQFDFYYQDTTRNSTVTYNTLGSHRYGFNLINPAETDKMKILLNIEQSQITLDNYEYQDKETSILVGLSFPDFHNIGSTQINYKGLIGQTFHDTTRKVYTNKNILNNTTGVVLTNQDYNSYHFNLGANTYTSFKKTALSNFGLTLGLDLNTQQSKSYSDDFYNYDSSTLSQLESLMQLLWESEFNKKLSLSANLNTKQRKIINGANQTYQLNGVSKSYSSDKSDIYFGGILKIKYQFSNKLLTEFSLNRQDSNDNVSSYGASLNLNYKF